MKRILFILFVIVSTMGMIAIEGCNGCQRRSGHNHKTKPHGKYEYDIKGVRIGFDMTREDLHKVNKKANIVPKSRENNKDGKRYDYLVVNNKLAVTFNVEVTHINQIVIWDQTFVYNDIRVGDSFGNVMKKNNVTPNEKTTLTFIYLHSWFDYRMQSYTRAICAYDETTCTSYLFFESQFSSELWQGIMSAVGYATSDKEFYLSALSSSTYASICSSVKLTQIVRWDCKCVKSVHNQPEPKSIIPCNYYLKFQDEEKYTLTDGSMLSASLTSFGLGDVWLKVHWSGKSPMKLEWELDSYGLAPTSGVMVARKSYDNYSISETFSDFKWVASNADVYGVKLIVVPISEEERKYTK